jgi:hypothetical protein
MATLLTRLKIHSVASVDRGAGKDVRVFLTKREGVCGECGAGGGLHSETCSKSRSQAHVNTLKKAWSTSDVIDMTPAWHADEADVLAYCKREFSDKDRQALADSGKAMPGGSFPIVNEEDLHNAIRAVGRAKNPGKARAHIKDRARAMGHSDAIPEDWGKAMSKILDFDKAMSLSLFKAILKAAVDNGAEDMDAMRKAAIALRDSALSIEKLDDEDERAEALGKTVQQCTDHLAAIVPAGSVEAFRAAVAAIPAVAKGKAMTKTLTLEELTASMEKLTKRNVYLENVAKMSQDHRDHMDDEDMTDDQREAFAAKTPAERDKVIGKTDDEGDGDNSEQQRRATPEGKPTKGGKPSGGKGMKGGSDIDKAIEKALAEFLKGSVCKECGGADGDHLKKCSNFGKRFVLEQVDKRDEIIADLQKRVASSEHEKEVELCKRLCRENGLPEDKHTAILKVRKSDPEAADDLLKQFKAMAAQANPKLFTELGKGGGSSDDPTVEINAKALELMNAVNKTAKPAERISIQKARMMAREQNVELAKRERDLEQRRRYGRAA